METWMSGGKWEEAGSNRKARRLRVPEPAWFASKGKETDNKRGWGGWKGCSDF